MTAGLGYLKSIAIQALRLGGGQGCSLYKQRNKASELLQTAKQSVETAIEKG